MELVRKLTLIYLRITLFLMIKCSLYIRTLSAIFVSFETTTLQPHVYDKKKIMFIKYTYYSCGFSVAKRLPIILYTDN